jgi:hypothetical protein
MHQNIAIYHEKKETIIYNIHFNTHYLRYLIIEYITFISFKLQ